MFLYIRIQEARSNMKKNLIIVLFVAMFSSVLIAQDFKPVEKIFNLKTAERFPEYSQSFETGKIDSSYFIWNFNHGVKIFKDSILCEQDGFTSFYYEGKKQTLIFGSNFLFCFEPVFWGTIDIFRPTDEQLKRIKNQRGLYIDNHDCRDPGGDFIPDFGVLKINSSSYYTEHLKSGTVEYIPDYLNVLIQIYIDNANFLLKNPWVPGKSNNSSGIGEYLEIEFSEPKDNIVVLNGYVDLEKRYLYKANNRVKKATVTSLDTDNPFEIEYEFEDYVHFSEIDFPAKVNKVRFTIDEVYKGEKWDDTCISAVITRWER